MVSSDDDTIYYFSSSDSESDSPSDERQRDEAIQDPTDPLTLSLGPNPPPAEFPPFLALPFDIDTNTLSFFDPYADKIHSLHLPEARHKVFLGSSHGWLAMMDEVGDILLLNPFSRARLRLPPVTRHIARVSRLQARMLDGGLWVVKDGFSDKTRPVTLYEMRRTFISEIILSCSPSSGEEVLAVGVLPQSSYIAYWRTGDRDWQLFNTELPGYVKSITYCNRKIYVVTTTGSVGSCCIGFHSMDKHSALMMSVRRPYATYSIITIGNQLLLVGNYELACGAKSLPRQYKIYRYGMHGPSSWKRVRNLDRLSLFISRGLLSNTFCGRFPYCIGNSVYFTEPVINFEASSSSGGHSIQIMDLANGNVQSVICHRAVQSVRELFWFVPHLV